MTKKIFAMFLAVLMVVSMLPTSVFAAEATCPGKGEHTLENCSYTVVKVTEPTCGAMGFTTYKCDKCGETFAESWVAPTGEHQWTDLPAQAPTCAKPGYEAGKQCSVCGKKVTGKEIPQLDKDAEECEWVDMTPAINCATGGTKKFECAFCGATWEFEVKPGEHAYNNDKPVLVTPATPEASGLAKVTCELCGDVKEVEVLYVHEHVAFEYPEVPATCTTTGMKAYKQCRVCDAVYFERDFVNYKQKGWYQLTEAEWASLVIPAEHTYDHEPTCVDTSLTCLICKQTVPQNVAHEVDWVETDWQKGDARHYFYSENATCSKDGWIADWCNVCKEFRDVKIIYAQGHKEITVTVPATCVSNAYSFTYCVRENCVEGKQNPVTGYTMDVETYKPATAPVVGEDDGFYLASAQKNNGYVVYFTGKMDGNYLATSYNVAEAVKVYLEIVHPYMDNAFFMYFYNAEGVKTYIEAYTYNSKDGKVGVQLTTTPSNIWSWDAALGTIVCEVETEKYGKDNYVIRTNDKYDTMGVTHDGNSKLQFVAVLGEVGAMAPANVIAYNIVKDSADLNAHKMTEAVILKPSCTEPGMKQVRCALCGGAADIVEIPAQHNYIKYPAATIKENGKDVPTSVPVTCEDGYQYFYCTGCKDVQKVVYTGYGHILGKVVEETPNHMVPVVYDHQDCIFADCDYSVKLTKKVWADANKHWDTKAEADKAHDGKLSATGTVIKAGNCKEYGLEMYTCADCKKAVYVKIAGTGDHVMPADTLVVKPTCTTDGGVATYQCERCKAVVGNAPLDGVTLNPIAKLGHKMAENKKYKAADCSKPNYNAYTHYCERCDYKQFDGTKLLYVVTFDTTNPCEAISYEYYACHCGKEHMISFITKLGHNMVELPRYDAEGKPTATFKAPTCYAEGSTTFYCTFCGLTKVETLAKVEHVNAAGEKFTDKCTDTVTDRHCVVCCKLYNHAAKGNAHNCSTADVNKDGKLDCLGECLIGKTCHYSINKKMPSTCLQDAYTLKVCADCGDQKVLPDETLNWNGHKPASNVEAYYQNEKGEVVYYENGPQPTILAGYVYDKDFVWYSVEVIDGEFVQHAEAYVAKYIEYVPATYTSEGYAKMYCQECKQVVTQTLPKLEGLGIELNVANGNGAKEFTFGSLVEVVVTANGLEESVYGFDFDLNFTNGLVFVGFEALNNDFIFSISNPEVVKNSVKFVAFADNDATGKMQNIEIAAGTELVKLYFRVAAEKAAELNFSFANAKATQIVKNAPVAIDCAFASKKIQTRTFLDFNKNGEFSVNDLYLAMSLLTGEHPTGATYDVTLDLNKDGEVTLEELSIAYSYYVGNNTKAELFTMGMSEAEIALVLCTNTLHCVQCGGEIAGYEVYCPHCGRNPK